MAARRCLDFISKYISKVYRISNHLKHVSTIILGDVSKRYGGISKRPGVRSSFGKLKANKKENCYFYFFNCIIFNRMINRNQKKCFRRFVFTSEEQMRALGP